MARGRRLSVVASAGHDRRSCSQLWPDVLDGRRTTFARACKVTGMETDRPIRSRSGKFGWALLPVANDAAPRSVGSSRPGSGEPPGDASPLYPGAGRLRSRAPAISPRTELFGGLSWWH